MYNLNQNLTAELKTKYGNTRKINIKDSLRQGGVLAVLQYGIMMDQINQAIKDKNLGIKIEDTEIKIPSLLWVDDVMVIAESIEELQQMLNVINEIAAEYHIEFGMPKSNILKIGKEEAITLMPLGEQAMTQTNNYKYLGFNITNKNKLNKHLEATKSKVEGAFQKILTVAGDANFKQIELSTIWKLIEAEITAIALNTAETWEPTKEENKKHNQILDNIIKRVLKVSKSTPREALYIETGLTDLSTKRIQNRINMEHRVNKKGSETTKTAMNAQIRKGWMETTTNLKTTLNIQNDTKQHIKEQTNKYFKQKTVTEAANKSKVQFLLNGKHQTWQPGKREKYLDNLTRNKASAIFKARTRMFPAKNNQRGNHPDLICRFCKKEDETQEHLLNECKTLHTDNRTKIKTTEIFAEYDENTKETANKLLAIMEKIDELEGNIPGKVNKYPCTKCNKQCRNGQNCIECDTCKKWSHQKCTNLTMAQFTDLCKENESSWECNTCKPQTAATTPTEKQQTTTRQPTITIRMSRNNQGEWNILQPQPKTPNRKRTTKRQKPAAGRQTTTPAAATSTRAGRQPKPRDRLNL